MKLGVVDYQQLGNEDQSVVVTGAYRERIRIVGKVCSAAVVSLISGYTGMDAGNVWLVRPRS